MRAEVAGVTVRTSRVAAPQSFLSVASARPFTLHARARGWFNCRIRRGEVLHETGGRFVGIHDRVR